MKRWLYGESVQGASHVRNNVPCQDNYKLVEYSDKILIASVADGHGSESCPYSKTGSKIATNVFCSVMEGILRNFADNMDFLVTYLNREGDTKIAQMIDVEWKRRVWKAHTDNKREKPLDQNGDVDKAAVYKQYGTTLLGLMITEQFVFAFQLGDGDILFVDQTQVRPVISGEKILGVETHSLCKMDAWKKSITSIRKRSITEDIPYLYLLSTDGFANSYKTEEDFHVTCRDYYALIQVHGFEEVTANMKDWLKETSELGCGDDTTVVMLYFDRAEEVQ